MTALRYLLALPRLGFPNVASGIALVDIPERARSGEAALWCSEPAQIARASDRRMLIIGHLFDRSGVRQAPSIEDAEVARIAACPEIVVQEYWGAYLAVIADRTGFSVLRDPTGLLPCYVAVTADAIFLASDIGTLTDAGLKAGTVDWDRLSEYLSAPAVRRCATCLEGISELSPGVLKSFGSDAAERRLWTPWAFTNAERRIASGQAVDALRESVISSIAAMGREYHNIVVGMSGGLNSSIVCAALSETGQRYAALTMYTADPSGDERSFARLVSERTRVPLLEHCYAPERIDLSRPASGHLPRPVGRTFMQEIDRAYRAEVAAHGFDVILTGNGGDNVFCYLHSAAPIVDRLRSRGARRGIGRTMVDMCRITQCDLVTMTRATLSLLARRHPRGSAPDMRLLDRDRQEGRSSPVLTPYLDEAPDLPGKRSHVEMIVRIQNHVEGYDRRDLPPSIPVLLAQPIVETCLRIRPGSGAVAASTGLSHAKLSAQPCRMRLSRGVPSRGRKACRQRCSSWAAAFARDVAGRPAAGEWDHRCRGRRGGIRRPGRHARADAVSNSRACGGRSLGAIMGRVIDP